MMKEKPQRQHLAKLLLHYAHVEARHSEQETPELSDYDSRERESMLRLLMSHGYLRKMDPTEPGFSRRQPAERYQLTSKGRWLLSQMNWTQP